MIIKWFRSWPKDIPPSRNYVVDHDIERVDMNGKSDYERILPGLADCVLIEWDIVIDPEMKFRFNMHIEEDPDKIHVAPYKLYPASTNLSLPVWAHRTLRDGQSMWINEWDMFCDYFGFGMIYFPRRVLSTAPSGAMANDDAFSHWHARHNAPGVPVHWDVRPIHLNY